MARINRHISAIPPKTRSSTVDSLYRDPSVAPRDASNACDSIYSVMSPSRSSEKENIPLDSRETTPQPTKRRGLGSASGRIPTPDTGSTLGTGNKRRRTGDYNMNSASEIYEDEHEEDEGAEQEQQQRAGDEQIQEEDEEDSRRKLYDPNQDHEKRRRVRYQLRDNHRQLEGGCSLDLGCGTKSNEW